MKINIEKKMLKKAPTVISLLQIGCSNVGKTALAYKFVSDIFKKNLLNTVGIDYVTKNVSIKGKDVMVKIWDTAGQERYQQITYQFIRKVEGIAFVYDIRNRLSFDNLKNRMEDVFHFKNDISYIIVGNKADLNDDQRVVSEWEGQKLANEYHVPFYETSALNGQNVKKSFEILINLVISQEEEIKKEILNEKPNNNKDKPANSENDNNSYFSLNRTVNLNDNDWNHNEGKCLKYSC